MAERADLIRAGLARAAMLAVLWAVLTEGSPQGWLAGALTILGATLVSVALVPPRTVVVNPRAVPGFVAYFLLQSFRGGVDVARRVFRPSLPLQPAIIVLPLRLLEGPARVVLASAASLMPGTLAVRLAEHELHLHVLDERLDVAASIAELERRIAAMLC